MNFKNAIIELSIFLICFTASVIASIRFNNHYEIILFAGGWVAARINFFYNKDYK